MIRTYIEKISESRDVEKMNELGNMLEELIYNLKDSHHELYEKYKMELYELAYGKTINEDMAKKWVKDMTPIGQHWTMEETTNASQSLNFNLNPIDFYVVANMMYNDYYDLVKDDEELALKLAYDWLNDEDAIKDKLYCYWKNIVRK